MKSISFTVKVITPTLMGGGFGQNDGIRPSEIKGMMRYWFRAVAGSVVGDNLEALKKLENQIFGSQDRKSPFRIHVYDFDKENSLENLNWNDLPIHTKYLGFVINLNKERLANIVSANSTFKIKFLFRNSIEEKLIKLVAYSFYLATALGGFGLRARRGFGNWQVIDVDLNNSDVYISKDELKEYSEENIKNIIQDIKDNIKDLLNIENEERNEEYKTIGESFIRIYSLSTSSWEETLNKLGERYKNYRKNNRPTTPEYFNIRNFVANGCRESEIGENNWNFAFGLPIQLNSKGSSRISIKRLLNINDRRPLGVGSFKIKHQNRYLERLPSTVWFSIKKLKNNYFVVLTYLEGSIFPDENNDEVFFVFSKKLIEELRTKNICNNPPKKIKVEYDANKLKDKARDFVNRGFNNDS